MGILRLLLALMVVVTHASVAFDCKTPLLSGLVAVEGFFAISGFYMAMVLNGKYIGKPKEFYFNRIMRILPSYWIVVGFSIIVGFAFPPLNIFHAILYAPFSPGVKVSLLTSNIALLGSDWLCFFTVDHTGHAIFTSHFLTEKINLNNYTYMPQSWSLPVEFGFYAAAPFFVRSPRRIACVVVLSFAIKLLTLRYFGVIDPWKYRFYFGELSLFGLGALLWHARIWYEARINFDLIGGPLLVGIIGASMIYRVFEPLGIAAAAGYILLISLSIPILFSYFKSNRIDRLVGELSFPVYILHMLVINVVKQLGLVWGFEISIAATLILATALAVVGDKIEIAFRRRTQTAATQLFQFA